MHSTRRLLNGGLERIAVLGNAFVPQVAAVIMHGIRLYDDHIASRKSTTEGAKDSGVGAPKIAENSPDRRDGSSRTDFLRLAFGE